MMKLENHERARKLIVRARVENISGGEREWLDRHLAACGECSNEVRALAGAIQSLSAFAVTASPDVVLRTNRAVRRRAEQLRTQRAQAAPLWIAAATSTVWVILTTPYAWSAFGWLGQITQIPDAVWQLGFLIWWFLPATVLGAVAVWRHTAKGTADSNWADETNWGQL